MKTLSQSITDYFKVRKLKKTLKGINHHIGCIQHDMHFGDPSTQEIVDANRKIEALYLHKSIAEGLLEYYKNRWQNICTLH